MPRLPAWIKRRDHWLIVSVLANGLLATALLSPSARVVTPASSSEKSATAPTSLKQVPVATTVLEAAQARPQESGAEWPKWIQQLRALGVSNRALASIVLDDFERRWEQRQRELHRKFEAGEIDANTLARAESQRERAQEEELSSALGETGFRAWQKESLLREFTVAGVSMTDEESERVYELRKTTAEQRRGLEEANQRGEIDRADMEERVTALDADYDAKLKGMLGENRISEVNTASDGVETEMHGQLRQLQLPAGQVDALIDVQRARLALQTDLGQAIGRDGESAVSNPETEARRKAIDAARDDSFAKIMGPTNFAEWQKASDPRFQTLQHYASAWQLDDADVANVYSTVRGQEDRAREYQFAALADEREGKSVDWAAVSTQINAVSQQSEQSLRRTLGDARVERLKRHDVLSISP